MWRLFFKWYLTALQTAFPSCQVRSADAHGQGPRGNLSCSFFFSLSSQPFPFRPLRHQVLYCICAAAVSQANSRGASHHVAGCMTNIPTFWRFLLKIHVIFSLRMVHGPLRMTQIQLVPQDRSGEMDEALNDLDLGLWWTNMAIETPIFDRRYIFTRSISVPMLVY